VLNNPTVLDFEAIRPYYDTEVKAVLQHYGSHPMFKALLQFTFPGANKEEIRDRLNLCDSIYDFQTNILYQSLQNLLAKSSDGFTTSGFDTLEKDKSYFYISNHRDIVLDTSLLNVALYDNGMIMTASAIGDNLVEKEFLRVLSRLNRNFLVQRGLSPRELLKSSKLLSAYIKELFVQNRSIWMAQREGRTKDGNDLTQQGVLKMVTMAKGDIPLMEFLKNYNIVPVAISYEFDPTDILKVPEVVAKQANVPYIKTINEDFNSIMKGALGNKKHIHIAVKELPEEIYDQIDREEQSDNDKLKRFAKAIDHHIYEHYKLWPVNYVAYDMYHKSNKYSDFYTDKEKRLFERRLSRRVNLDQQLEVDSFLLMYANPVINKEAL